MLAGFAIVLIALCLAGCRDQPWPPGVQDVPAESPVLPPEEALKSFYLPPGFRIELVAAEPLVRDPVAIDFDGNGRMYVVEMRGYMPNLEGEGEERPLGRVVVLEDGDGDGQMDRQTVFLDGLVLPRAIKVLGRGVLVGAPPHLWLARDTDGDLRADTREIVRDDYGDPEANPEHNANGLWWGIDNWIHNAKDHRESRLRNGRWEHRETPPIGQWGVSSDDWGRLYRNYNEDPLHVDLVPAHYLARNPNLTRTRGIYEEMTKNGPVWPVRPTPGVNRGYRERTLRPDSTLAHFTAAGSPVAFRGNRLPDSLRNDVFVSEPAGNLVRRFAVRDSAEGMLAARNAYEGAEFLASTDERFRPVNLYSAPDGTLYVVDMYRGIIQHRYFLTDYLKNYIRASRLEQPIGFGRIYRIVHRSRKPGPKPQLSRVPSAALVEHLSHPNGWWRDNAQRILVERGDRSVAPALRRLALSAPDARTRLHALWTLDGVLAADPATLARALADPSPHVRAAAIRLAEPWLAQPDHPLRVAVLRMTRQPDPEVRRQLAASLGELPVDARESALAELVRRHGQDPIVVDLAVSGLQGRELAFLERLLNAPVLDNRAVPPGAVEILAATVMKAGDMGQIQTLLAWIGEESRPVTQRLTLLAGMHEFVPKPNGGRGEFQPFRLGSVPQGLLTAAAGRDPQVRTQAQALAAILDWPGKPGNPNRNRARPLDPDEQGRFDAGRQQYLASCAGCHQPNGMGLEGVAKRLVGSRWVLGAPHRLARIVLHGKEGEMLMPPMGGALTDEQIAAVMTYIRRDWGHQADPVNAEFVREIRGQTTGRSSPWTDDELNAIRP